LSTSAGRLVQSATGIEIDPHYGKPAKALWSGTPLQLIQSDFTRMCPPADESKRATLLVCNPPYVRHHHLAASEKKRLQAASQKAAHIDLSGLCGLYCHFMALAHNWLSEGGVGAW
jgi:adenine-specific DNA-methyltransferase